MFFLSHTSELIIGQNISIGRSGQMTEKLEIAAESNLQDCDLANQNRNCGFRRRRQTIGGHNRQKSTVFQPTDQTHDQQTQLSIKPRITSN